MNCKVCGKPLTYNEAGLNKKFLGRACENFYCRLCLAEKLGVSEQRLLEKQKQFLRSGCTLFVEE